MKIPLLHIDNILCYKSPLLISPDTQPETLILNNNNTYTTNKQPYRITTPTVPRGGRKLPAVAPPAQRSMFATPFFHPAGGELGPLFRLLDSAAADLFPSSSGRGVARRSFTPRFDVREMGSTYELQGEVPGIQQGDLQIEFEDERTLVIRGKTDNSNVKDNTTATATPAVEGAEAAEPTSDAASDKSSGYHKASVEDEYVDAGEEVSQKPAAEKSNDNAQVSAPAGSKTAEPSFKYWVSERSVGEFERRFAFPGPVDQDAVTASLKNGILSVVVPKIVDKQAKKIAIQ